MITQLLPPIPEMDDITADLYTQVVDLLESRLTYNDFYALELLKLTINPDPNVIKNSVFKAAHALGIKLPNF